MYSSLSTDQLNLFLSSAKGDGIFIWDVRSQRLVQIELHLITDRVSNEPLITGTCSCSQGIRIAASVPWRRSLPAAALSPPVLQTTR